MRQKCVVRYQVASYSGTEIVYCDENDDEDQIKAKAKRQLNRSSGGFWPIGVQQFDIISREDYDGE